MLAGNPNPARAVYPWSVRDPSATRETFTDFDPDRLARIVPGCSMEHTLLEASPFEATNVQARSKRLALNLVRYSRRVALRGRWERGKCSIVMLVSSAPGSTLFGLPWAEGTLACFNQHCGMDCGLAAGATWAAVTCDEAILDGELGRLAADATARLIAADERHRARLASVISAAESRVRSTHGSDASQADSVEAVLSGFLAALTSGQRRSYQGERVLRRHHSFMTRADEHLHQNLGETLKMPDLCRSVGTSSRVLEYAFHNTYNMGAMAFMRARRLSGARKALLRATPDDNVTSIAMHWGFWHLGEFSVVYKRMFGEMPSRTLQRSAGRAVTRDAEGTLDRGPVAILTDATKRSRRQSRPVRSDVWKPS